MFFLICGKRAVWTKIKKRLSFLDHVFLAPQGTSGDVEHVVQSPCPDRGLDLKDPGIFSRTQVAVIRNQLVEYAGDTRLE